MFFKENIKAYLLENDKTLDIIKLPHNSAATLLRYEEPEQYCEYETGGWRCDVYYEKNSNGKQIILTTGTLPFGNYIPSLQLIAEYEAKAIQLNSKLIPYREKKCYTQAILQEFIDEVIWQRVKWDNEIRRCKRKQAELEAQKKKSEEIEKIDFDKEIAELEAKQKDLETKKRENGATD